MRLPRLRKKPMEPEKGGPKRARAAQKHVLAGRPFTVHVTGIDGSYVAWVEECGEDEFGMLARSDRPEHALWRLGADLQKVIHEKREESSGSSL